MFRCTFKSPEDFISFLITHSKSSLLFKNNARAGKHKSVFKPLTRAILKFMALTFQTKFISSLYKFISGVPVLHTQVFSLSSRSAKISGTKARPGGVTAWRMHTELGMEIAQRIYLYIVLVCLFG